MAARTMFVAFLHFGMYLDTCIRQADNPVCLVHAGMVVISGVQMPFHRPVMQQESIDMLVSRLFPN